ncbi:MAG: peptidyl-prolyl cis-trans isomerase [Candidatus Omnitrophota bacterium]
MNIKTNLKIILFFVLFNAYSLLNTGPFVGKVILTYAQDKIVAIVNQDVVTQKDLTDFLNFMRLQLSREYKGRELEEKIQGMKRELLSKLIDDLLILQEAKKNNLPIDESKVKTKINEVKKEYPSESIFHAELMKQGLTQADIEKKLKEQFMMFAVIDYKVRSKIIIKPEEVTEFYEKHRQEFNTGESRLVEVASTESLDTAKKVVNELNLGKSITELALQYPIVVNKININKDSGTKEEIKEVVSKLMLNEVSMPISLGDRYYIFKVIGLTPSVELTLLQAQERIRAILFERKMQEGITNWLAQVKKNSYVKIMQD